MIKLFRRFRKAAAGKYLLYAIGEIILVVIGILIALQINNWNQDRIRDNKETILLGQLKGELLNSYDDVLNDFNKLKIADSSHYIVLDHLKAGLPYVDSLCFHFDWLRQDEFTYPNRAIYDKIKEEGLDIITNDSIRLKLQLLYEELYPRIARTTSFTPPIDEFFQEFYFENFKLNTDLSLNYYYPIPSDTLGGRIYNEWEFKFPDSANFYGKNRKYTMGTVPLDYESLRANDKFYMMLDQADKYRGYRLGRYLQTRKSIRDLVTNISQELKNRDD